MGKGPLFKANKVGFLQFVCRLGLRLRGVTQKISVATILNVRDPPPRAHKARWDRDSSGKDERPLTRWVSVWTARQPMKEEHSPTSCVPDIILSTSQRCVHSGDDKTETLIYFVQGHTTNIKWTGCKSRQSGPKPKLQSFIAEMLTHNGALDNSGRQHLARSGPGSPGDLDQLL